MLAFLGALGLGGASGISNYFAQKEANDTNKKIADEANQQQYQMFKEQMGYQTAERLATQEYNSPANQRLLYEQAGFNPYSVVGNMKPETVAQSAPAAPNQHVATVSPASLSGSVAESLGNILPMALQSESLGLDNESKRIDLMFKTSEKILDIDNKIVDLSHKKNLNKQDQVKLQQMQHERDLLAENLDLLRSNKSQLKIQEKLRTKTMRLENRAKELLNEYQEWQNEYSKKYGNKQLELIDAHVKEALSSAAANASLSANYVADTAIKKLQAKGVAFDNQQKKLLRGHVLKMARLEEEGQRLNNELTRYNTGVNGKDWLRAGESIFGPLAGYTLGRFNAVKGAANVKSVQAVPRTPTIYY